jgi:hypothetical protein
MLGGGRSQRRTPLRAEFPLTGITTGNLKPKSTLLSGTSGRKPRSVESWRRSLTLPALQPAGNSRAWNRDFSTREQGTCEVDQIEAFAAVHGRIATQSGRCKAKGPAATARPEHGFEPNTHSAAGRRTSTGVGGRRPIHTLNPRCTRRLEVTQSPLDPDLVPLPLFHFWEQGRASWS